MAGLECSAGEALSRLDTAHDYKCAVMVLVQVTLEKG